jgi:hypothetical protein
MSGGRHRSRVARFLLVRDTKTGKMYQINEKFPIFGHKISQMSVCKIFQMTVNHIHCFQSKALKNLPKLGFWFENKPSGNPAPV